VSSTVCDLKAPKGFVRLVEHRVDGKKIGVKGHEIGGSLLLDCVLKNAEK
jgi:hypothetical protein